MSDALVIDVAGLNKHFGERHVVRDLALQVRHGEIFGFLGPNGSGKTTSIRMLCGLLVPDSGQGTCLGHDLIRETAAIKREVGYMTQRFSLWEDLTIAENLDFVARMYGLAQRRAMVSAALERLGLAARRKQLAGTLSGGWKQRLALAACLIHRPKLLLLDEPTAGLDPDRSESFVKLISSLHRQLGLTVVLVTHDLDTLAGLATRVAVLAEQRILALGTIDDIMKIDHPFIRNFFCCDRAQRALQSRTSEGTA